MRAGFTPFWIGSEQRLCYFAFSSSRPAPLTSSSACVFFNFATVSATDERRRNKCMGQEGFFQGVDARTTFLVITQYEPLDYIQLMLGRYHQKDPDLGGYTGTPIL